jgi:hypothetical protein
MMLENRRSINADWHLPESYAGIERGLDSKNTLRFRYLFIADSRRVYSVKMRVVENTTIFFNGQTNYTVMSYFRYLL